MKLSRAQGKPLVTTQPASAKAVYVQTTDGSYWDGQQFVWPLPESGAFESPYDALAFAIKAQSAPKMQYEEEDLRVVLRDIASGDDQLVITVDQSQLLPVLEQRWEKHIGTQFDQTALQAAKERINSVDLPAFFLNAAPGSDQENVVDLESVRGKKLATDHLLDLADLALASNGLGNNSINRDEVGQQLQHLSDDDAREHLQKLVNSEIERVYGEENAPDFIKPLSSYEGDLEAYKAYLQNPDAHYSEYLQKILDQLPKTKPLSPLQQLIADNAATALLSHESSPEQDAAIVPTAQAVASPDVTAKENMPLPLPERPEGFQSIAAQRSFAGRLVAHGEAPYKHDAKEKPSYFVTYEHNGEQHTLWGKDLPNALGEARVKLGDYVQLDYVGSQPVQVLANLFDENGKKTGEEWQTKHFNMWRGKAVDEKYCSTFVPKEKPAFQKGAAQSPRSNEASRSGPGEHRSNGKKPGPGAVNEAEPQRQTMVPGPGKAGSGIGSAIGSMLGGLHRAGSSMASNLSGANKRDLAHRQSVEQHEQLVSAMTHSAARASAAATALTTGALAPVMAEIKQRGVELDQVLNTDQHPDLKDSYRAVVDKHGAAVKAALGELDWYATKAAESAKESGFNIQPEVDEAIDKVKADAKDIALPDENGKWTSISDALDKVLEKVHELIRQIFTRLTPGSAQP